MSKRIENGTRVITWASLALVLSLLVVLTAIGTLVGSNRGFAFVVAQVEQHIDALRIGEVSGNLLDGFAVTNAEFKNDTLAIEARRMDSVWRISCLLHVTLCVDNIVIDELRVQTLGPGTRPHEKPTDDISLPSIDLPVDIQLKKVSVRQVVFQTLGKAATQTLKNVRLSASTEGEVLTIDTLAADYRNYSVASHGILTLDKDYPLDITVQLDADKLIGQHAAALKLKLDNTIRDLAFKGTISGAVTATLSGTVRPLEKTLPVDLALNSTAMGWPLKTHETVLAKALAMKVEGDMENYNLSVSTRLSGKQIPDLKVMIDGRANTRRLDLSTIRVDTLDGNIAGTAGANFGDDLSWRTNLTMTGIQPARKYPEVSGRLNGRFAATGSLVEEGWTLALDTAHVDGTLREQPFVLTAKIERSPKEAWSIERFEVNNGPNRIDASGQVSDAWDLAATLALSRPQNLMPELTGDISADLKVTGKLATPNVDLRVSADELAVDDIVMQGISLLGDVERAALDDSSLQVKVAKARVDRKDIKNVSVALTGTRADHALKLHAEGPESTRVAFAGSGSLADNFNWQGSLNKVQIDLPDNPVRLERPTRLTWHNADRLFGVDANCWISLESRLCLKSPIKTAPKGSAHITLDQFGLGRLDAFLPAFATTLEGTLEADAKLTWGEKLPGGDSCATLNIAVVDGGATVSDANGRLVAFAYESITLDADIDSRNIDGRLQIMSQQLGNANLSFDMSSTGKARDINGKFDIRDADIGVARAFAPQLNKLRGTIDAEGNLSGSVTDPRINGQIRLSRLGLQSDTLPLAVTEGAITADIQGTRATLDGTLGTNDNGRVALKGSADWQQSEDWRAEVDIDGTQLDIRQGPLIESVVDSALTVRLQPSVVRVGGTIQIPFARINVAQLPAEAKSLSDDVVIVKTLDQKSTAPRTPPTELPFDVIADVDVSIGDDVDIAAYGLTASLAGDVSVSARDSRPPELSGRIDVTDGVFRKYGQDLQASGSVLFAGPVSESRLDIEAIRKLTDEDRTAGLHIDGAVDSPTVTLFTEPADKTNAAILSYIVLGHDISQASDQQASVLASAALALSVKGGKTIGSDVADKLGIEDFALITTGSGNDTDVVASGRVDRDVLLSYGQNIYDGQRTLSLRYNLTKKLYLQAVEGAFKAVDLYYSFVF